MRHSPAELQHFAINLTACQIKSMHLQICSFLVSSNDKQIRKARILSLGATKSASIWNWTWMCWLVCMWFNTDANTDTWYRHKQTHIHTRMGKECSKQWSHDFGHNAHARARTLNCPCEFFTVDLSSWAFWRRLFLSIFTQSLRRWHFCGLILDSIGAFAFQNQYSNVQMSLLWLSLYAMRGWQLRIGGTTAHKSRTKK